MDKLVEQIILQMPVVGILLYNNIRQEKRLDYLLQATLNCLKLNENTINDGIGTISQ